MLFREIPGNKIIKNRLIQSVLKDRVSHAQLFLGNQGCAKLAIAIAYARFLNCEKKIKNDSCSSCSSCVKYKNLEHPDLHLVFPILKVKKMKKLTSDNFVNQWRGLVLKNPYISLNNWIDEFELENKTGQQGMIYKDQAKSISEKLQLKNYEAKYRVVIIWMPELMNLETSNKLLKLLEEPPLGTIFLAIGEDKNRMLKTIVSRLQIINVANFKRNDIQSYFSEKNTKDQGSINNLINLVNLDLGRIIQTLNHPNSSSGFFDFFSQWMRLVYKKDIEGITKWTENISSIGRKNQRLFCGYAIKVVRECLMYRIIRKEIKSDSKEEVQFIKKFSVFINEKNVISIVKEFESTIKYVNRNGNAKILFFNLSLQCIKFLTLKPNLIKN